MTRTMRFRTTAVAVLVVAVALVIASTLLVVFLRRSLTSNVRSKAETRAVAIAETIRSEGAGELTLDTEDDDYFVKVFDTTGNVVASSLSATGFSFIPPDPGETRRIHAPFDDDPFLVVTESVEGPMSRAPHRVVVGHTLDTVVETTATTLGVLALGVPILLALVGVVTWRVVGRALAPVEAIRGEVEDISGADLGRRVPVPPAGDEITRLAITMNQMLERLDAAQERQKHFVSDASHELRSPVASIRQLAEVALKHPSTGSIQELAGAVLAEDLRLQRLVEDLLLLNRIDEGAAEKADVDLDDLVFEEVDRVKQNGDGRFDASRVSAGRVRGDRKSLARLVANLLENASRHANGAVGVSLLEENGFVVLRVDDDGAGVPVSDRTRVFERFVRLEDARDRDSGGSGLGLAIVAEVAHQHGGRAEILDGPDGGARVEVRLPRAQ